MNAGVGLMLPRDVPSGEVISLARLAESLGFASVWLPEDLGFRGGFAQAGVVLASTETIRVGIGIIPAGSRTAAFAAMEASTLGELFPGRFDLGIGHGLPEWMESVGAWPASPLTLLEETVVAVKSLMRGRPVVAGRHVRADGMILDSLPIVVPDVLLGVRRPRSLALSGRVADGTVLSEPCPPEYVRSAVSAIGHRHRIVAYNLCAVHGDIAVAREFARPALGSVSHPAAASQIDPLPFASRLRELAERSADGNDFARELPDEWIDALAIVGDVARVRRRLDELEAAGVTEHVLVPSGPDFAVQATRIAEVLT